jgi:hypothetical protein
MSSKMSVEEVLSELEQRATFHREQEAFHTQEEVRHREERALHAAELEKVLQSLETFRAAASTAVRARSTAAKPVPAKPVQAEEPLPPPDRLMVGKLLRRVALSPSLAEPFGPSAVAAEANRRYAGRLPRPVDIRTASDVLRRMLAEGEIRLARKGKAFHEALYTRSVRRGG